MKIIGILFLLASAASFIYSLFYADELEKKIFGKNEKKGPKFIISLLIGIVFSVILFVKGLNTLGSSSRETEQSEKVIETPESIAKAKKEQEENDKSKTIKDSPLQVWLNTGTLTPTTNLTSSQIENNRNYYDGKVVKGWVFTVYDVTSSGSVSIQFIDTYDNGNLHFSLGEVKSWGKLDKNTLSKNQRIRVKRAVLKKELLSGFYLMEAELD